MKKLNPIRIPDERRQKLRIMFIAKHALADGSRDAIDGDHAVYHREVRDVLEGLGLDILATNDPRMLLDKPPVDFVFSLLNRGGYLNSEMFVPLLCERAGIPYLGASPIIRGLSDDKHLMKMCARARGVATAPSSVFRRFAPVQPIEGWSAKRYVIKPNASSASWGVSDATSWLEVEAAVRALHAEGHDVLVEPFMPGIDIELPVIGSTEPVMLPLMRFDHDPTVLRTYEEKRGFVQSAARLAPVEDAALIEQVEGMTRRLIPELWPFDYGRFEFRLNTATGEINFLEVNLQCNLWSKRVIGQSARLGGLEYPDLLETILADSLKRWGLI